MFIAIVGTPSSGKRSLLNYLVQRHGFREVGLERTADVMEGAKLIPLDHLEVPMKAMAMSSGSSPATTPLEQPSTTSAESKKTFSTPSALLDYITRNWLTHLVTTDLRTYAEIEGFLKRPFGMVVSVDGPLRSRFERERERNPTLTLDAFIDTHDTLHHGPPQASSSTSLARFHPQTDFARVMSLAQVKVINNLSSLEELWAYLDGLNLLDEERLRPGWDTYFMTLASLASHRSNCMKRRVGALLVRSKRILSTGYNGTPRGTRNCNHGGCRRCNGSARGGEALDECLCLHAEENALLEAGRERIGEDSVIYCNTCPCLRCSVKIVQCGVREVVYNQSYSMDEASAMVLKEGGVILRQLHMPP